LKAAAQAIAELDDDALEAVAGGSWGTGPACREGDIPVPSAGPVAIK